MYNSVYPSDFLHSKCIILVYNLGFHECSGSPSQELSSPSAVLCVLSVCLTVPTYLEHCCAFHYHPHSCSYITVVCIQSIIIEKKSVESSVGSVVANNLDLTSRCMT